MPTVDERPRLRLPGRLLPWQASSVAVAAFAVVAALAAGWYIAEMGISFREIVVVLLAAGVTIMVLTGERGLSVGLVLWTLTLGLGYRTVQLTDHIKLHPAELLLLGLLALLIITRLILGTGRMTFWFPRWVLLMIPFWLWGWVPGLLEQRPWDLLFSEFRNSLLLLPLFWVVANLLREGNRLYSLLLAFYATGTYIATLGMLEYFFPGVAGLLPGFISDPSAMLAPDGFQRAAFSFYGHQNAVFVCALSLPFGLVLLDRARQQWQKVAVAAAFVLQISGVFIAGFRSMWLALAVLLSAILIRSLGFARGVVAVVIAAALSVPLFPSAVERRVGSLILTLSGRPDDSSGQDRWIKVKEATEITLENPLGQGWGGSGWVHSDFLQVAGNLGIAAGIVFLCSYLVVLHRLWRRVAWNREAHIRGVLTFCLFLSFLTAGWLLATEPMIVLPQTVLPIWLVWVLVELELRRDPRQDSPSGYGLVDSAPTA